MKITSHDYHQSQIRFRSPQECLQAMTNHPPPGETVLGTTQAGLHPENGEGDSVRSLLREATRDEHRRIDQTISRLQLADRTSYRTFLAIHYMALRALSGCWRAADEADLSALSLCLLDDLVDHPADIWVGSARRAEANSLQRWGVAYVIRGSRLGGAILRQRVPTGYPTSFLDFAPALTWPVFLKQLEHETRSTDSRARSQIVEGAQQAFGAFATAAATFGLRHE